MKGGRYYLDSKLIHKKTYSRDGVLKIMEISTGLMHKLVEMK